MLWCFWHEKQLREAPCKKEPRSNGILLNSFSTPRTEERPYIDFKNFYFWNGKFDTDYGQTIILGIVMVKILFERASFYSGSSLEEQL